MRRLFVLLALACSAAAAAVPPLNLGLGFSGVQSNSPLNLPLVQQSNLSSIFQFQGSFKIPTTIVYGGGTMSVSGSTLYVTALCYDYLDSSKYVPGIAAVTIPTLSGTPAYDGSNGGTATQVFSPTREGCTSSTWSPVYPFGNASGDMIAGSAVYGSNLLLTGGTYYDANCNQNLGWILSANASTGQSWGTVNQASGLTSQQSRELAGVLGQVPSIWQPYLGGPMFDANKNGSLSIDSCYVPIGYSFTTFDPSTVTGGATVPITTHLDYYYQGGFNAAYPQQATGRILTGPFPLTTSTGYYPATLTAAPSAGTTSVTIALPSGTVTATANITNGSNNIDVTSITSGTLSNSGILYTVTDTAGALPSGDETNPTWTLAPGVAAGTGTYVGHLVAVATATGDTVTFTPMAYSGGYYRMLFSDGETRTAYLGANSGLFPNPISGTNDHATFAALTGSSTTSVQVAPMSDAVSNAYDGPLGTVIIEPNSSSMLFLSIHQYGPPGPRADACNNGASGSNGIPLTPDSGYYYEFDIDAYSIRDIVSAAHVYSPSPYGVWPFPGESALHDTTANKCLTAAGSGWAAYDHSSGMLYAIFGRYVDSLPNGQMIVDVWKVNPL